MSKHKHNADAVDATASEVVAEEPKTKIGDKADTVVDAAAKEKKPRVQKAKVSTYRILDGVDVTKFNGQRKQVVTALQKLSTDNPDASFSVDEIVASTEGLVSKTPVEASVLYHLKGLAADKHVEVTEPPAAEATKAA